MAIDEPWGPAHGPGRVKALLELAKVEADAAGLKAITELIGIALTLEDFSEAAPPAERPGGDKS